MDRLYLNSKAQIYGNLEPSQPIIDAFLTEALYLDVLLEIDGISHAKRVKWAKQIKRTAQRESGYGKSKLAHRLNNHVGTKLARKRFTWASGKGYLNYAKFDNWAYSYLDCLEYIKKYGHSWIQ
jgi:ribosomal protein L32